jgi:hypothetical protein
MGEFRKRLTKKTRRYFSPPRSDFGLPPTLRTAPVPEIDDFHAGVCSLRRAEGVRVNPKALVR